MKRNWVLPASDFTDSTLTEAEKAVKQFIKTREYSSDTLSNSLDDLPSETLLKDLPKAVKRIFQAIKRNEKIIVYGHDDLDGITSCYLIFDFLSCAGSVNHYYYLPNRLVDRHGICQNALDFAVAYQAKLIISVDNGISSVQEVKDLNEIGIDTIILDHHIPGDELPSAYAIINPKQEDCQYPEKMLAGVGVCFMIVRELCRQAEIEFKDVWYFWTAVGTIADKVPLQGINRKIVKFVMHNFELFLKDYLLMYLYNQQKKFVFNPSKMGFINFVIRTLYNGRELNGKNKSFQLIMSNQFEKELLYNDLQQIREQNDTLIKQNLKWLEENILYTLKKNEFKFSQNGLYEFNEGVYAYTKNNKLMLLLVLDKKHNLAYSLLGIHANFLYHELKVPVIMLKHKHESNFVAEARGPKWFDLVNSFNYCQEFFIQYGGHVKAAGFLIEEKRILPLLSKLNEFILTNEFSMPEINNSIKIDAEFSHFNKETIDYFYEMLEPFGQSFSEPLILIKNYNYSEEDRYYFYNLPEEITLGENYDLLVEINEHKNYRVKDWEKSITK